MSIVVPACGTNGFLTSDVDDVLSRACPSLRLLVASSNSASPMALSVLRGVRRESDQISILCLSRGRKTKCTQGGDVRHTEKECVTFYSDSSQ